jgi:hypothetical protein
VFVEALVQVFGDQKLFSHSLTPSADSSGTCF